MISTVTNRGTVRFMIHEGALNVALFLTFLKRLARGARKIVLIVDNLKVHHRRRSRPGSLPTATGSSWSSCRPTRPSTIPDELLNSDVKRSLAKRPPPPPRGVEASLGAYMRQLQRLPEKIRAFFHAPTTAYAA